MSTCKQFASGKWRHGSPRRQLFLMVLWAAAGMAVAGFAESEDPVAKVVFVAFDTETTGFSTKTDRLIEIGAVRFRGDGEILAVTNWLVNPQQDISRYATEVNGIDNRMVRDAPLFEQVFPQFAAFCEGGVLLAHQASFDIGFLRAELARAELDAPPLPVLDTLPLFRTWFPGAASYSLERLSVDLGVPGETYHRAAADSFHIVRILGVGLKSRPHLQLRELENAAGGVHRLNGDAN